MPSSDRRHRPEPPDSQNDWDQPREVAIPRLLDRHGSRLYALGRRICGRSDEGEDLVQEVFMQAWRMWDQFDGRSDPAVWLYTIARRACQRMHRRRAGEPDGLESLDESLPFDGPRMAVPDSDTLDAQHRREQREAVGAAITTLPGEFRLALVLKDIVGFSIAEVAEILDVKEATVKTRIHRARLRLRQALERGLPERELPPPAYSRQVCMDLLQTKQDALDRGVEMPNASAIICDRCQAVFATLDLTRDACGALAEGELPAGLRNLLLTEMKTARPS
ncbi:MAG: RNA polymerase sigma factor [Planctomycetes bacterium]|nr:RNA polymerase sigma factor [Planctomycetota bacterium]